MPLPAYPARWFDVDAPDRAWGTDITISRTREGFAYPAVVIDLFSRRVIGWSSHGRQIADVVLQELPMAVWRRKPKGTGLVHSDQGSQFTSMDRAAVLKQHNLEHFETMLADGSATVILADGSEATVTAARILSSADPVGDGRRGAAVDAGAVSRRGSGAAG